jgi:hypothetical protein
MRKTLMALAGASVLAIGFAGTAFAGPAAVINDQGCFAGASITPPSVGAIFATSDHVTDTNNARGNAQLTCKFSGNPAVAKAFKSTGFTCGILLAAPGPGFVVTTNSRLVYTASGNATLSCKTP